MCGESQVGPCGLSTISDVVNRLSVRLHDSITDFQQLQVITGDIDNIAI